MDQDLIKGLVDELDKKLATDISVLNISSISPMADYFVIATGKNEHQLDALRDAAEEYMHNNGIKLKSLEGRDHSDWILMDFGDVIVHIFSEEKREYYDLDRIWRDAEKIL